MGILALKSRRSFDPKAPTTARATELRLAADHAVVSDMKIEICIIRKELK